jgi:hypothetical protein
MTLGRSLAIADDDQNLRTLQLARGPADFRTGP